LAALAHPIWDSQTFLDMFKLALPIAEKMIRPIIVYIFLVVVLRIFGKRELTNINPFDFVVLLTLSNTVQNAIIGDDNTVTGGLIGAFTLLLMNYLVVRFIFKHRRLDQLVEGSPTTLIEDGKLMEKNLAKELLTEAELTTVAHRQGFSNLDEIDHCVLEPGGNFYLKGKDPGVESIRHGEVLKALESLGKQVTAIEAALKRGV
jgi:uncharacterized membrane protein YcaP (DUF421 family)